MMSVYSISNPVQLYSSKRSGKWIFQDEGVWYFYTPINNRVLNYNSDLSDFTKGKDLRRHWLYVCLLDYIDGSWYKEDVKRKKPILYKYDKSEIFNRGLRKLMKSDIETFRKFRFGLGDLCGLMKTCGAKLDPKTLNLWNSKVRTD